jgi:hypothetical protein
MVFSRIIHLPDSLGGSFSAHAIIFLKKYGCGKNVFDLRLFLKNPRL